MNRGAFLAARAARPIVQRKGYARALPSWLARYDRFRALPAPAPRPLSALFRKEKKALRKRTPVSKGRVTLFPGCLIQHVYPEVGLAAARVLARLGYDVFLGPTACCGFPPWNSGHAASARRAFRNVLKRLEGEGPVITLCPTCTTMLAHAGPDLILGHRGTKPRRQSDGDGDDFQDIKELAARVVTFSQFLGRHDKEALLRIFAEGRPVRRATYHDSCHHKHVLRASEDSRTLVRMALRTELLEMTGPAACCGFAGAYSVDHPEVAEALLADKLAVGDGLGRRSCRPGLPRLSPPDPRRLRQKRPGRRDQAHGRDRGRRSRERLGKRGGRRRPIRTNPPFGVNSHPAKSPPKGIARSGRSCNLIENPVDT